MFEAAEKEDTLMKSSQEEVIDIDGDREYEDNDVYGDAPGSDHPVGTFHECLDGEDF